MSAGAAILYEGPSALDGQPIVAIAAWGRSFNPKTGRMAQTWMIRADVSPGEAKRTGADASVCGDCPHRLQDGWGTCYVNVAWGVSAVYRKYRAGGYPAATEGMLEAMCAAPVRLGTYGDPAAVPIGVWEDLARRCAAAGTLMTGYTHQWRRREAAPLRRWTMASVESEPEAREAQKAGWRPFLVVPHNRQIPKGFVWCPSDTLQPGEKIPCDRCGACSGTEGGRKPVAIFAHGNAGHRWTLGRERQRRTFEERHDAGHEPVVRMGPTLHAAMRRHAKGVGKTGRKFVEEAVREKMAADRADARVGRAIDKVLRRVLGRKGR